MKKLVALILVTMFITTANADDRSFRFGLTLSPNIGWFNPDLNGLSNDGVRLGYSFGLMGDFRLGDNYAISTGLNVLNMGGSIQYPDVHLPDTDNFSSASPGQTTATLAYRYVDIPFTIKMKTNEIGYMTYFGQFGLGTSVNIRSRADLVTRSIMTSRESYSVEGIDVSSQTPLLRMGLIIGLGAEYNLSGNTRIMFGVTYNNSIFNQFRSNRITPIDTQAGSFDRKINSYEADGQGFAKVEDGELVGGDGFKAFNNIIMLNFGIFF